jgi:ATP-dependent Clp protease ATP-binding subunit ClpB
VHHGVRIQDGRHRRRHPRDRYITDRQLPDKAIDLIDEAASAGCAWRSTSKPAELDEVDRQIMQLEIEREALEGEGQGQQGAPEKAGEGAGRPAGGEPNALRPAGSGRKPPSRPHARDQGEIEQCAIRSSEAERRYDYQRASELRYGELARLENELAQQEEQLKARCRRTASSCSRKRSTPRTWRRRVSNWTGIPVSRLLEGEIEKLLRMEDRLHRRVVGQDRGHQRRRQRRAPQPGRPAGSNRPIGSFPVLGPDRRGQDRAGAGLAEFLFDNQDAMVRIDMSEYQERHTVSA